MVEGAAGNAPLLWLVNPSRANRDRRQRLINQPLNCRKNLIECARKASGCYFKSFLP